MLFGRTYALESTIERIVDGVSRRSPSVYGQGWLRAVHLVRGSLPGIVARTQGGSAGRAEAALREGGASATRPVGAGGAAATRPHQ